MIVRKYGRRNRGIARTCSDAAAGGFDDVVDDDVFVDSLSQDSQIEFNQFSSQDSSHLWSLDSELYVSNSELALGQSSQVDWENGDARKSKKAKNGKRENSGGNKEAKIVMFPSTATLMETQEGGEMMEHEDEVYFALDGLRKGQPMRIRRASLLALLSISATAQQRRLLRIQGMTKSIVDRILELNSDDTSSNLAAATLLYILTIDGQDEYLLESHHCIRYLLKLLKPLTPAIEVRAPSIGSKLAAFRKEADTLRDAAKILDSNSDTITNKVYETLVNCKELEPMTGDGEQLRRPELSPKWVALLTLEKACVSKISIEDSGSIKKSGGIFKERLRELGGLDSVFEVAADCYCNMEGCLKKGSLSNQESRDSEDLHCLMLLLKCLKIMENATFLSKDNQSHLLEMKRRLNCHKETMSFVQLILHIIRILSGLSLLRKPSAIIDLDKEASSAILGILQAFDDPELIDFEDCKESNTHSSRLSCRGETSLPEKFVTMSQNSHRTSDTQTYPISSSNASSLSETDTYSLKLRISSSTSGSCSGRTKSSDPMADDDDLGFGKKPAVAVGGRSKVEDSDDPFAFDEDDFEPTRWDVLSQNKAKKAQKGKTSRKLKNEIRSELIMSQQVSSNDVYSRPQSSFSAKFDKEHFSFIADCLLSAVKVLMNLSNDNPIGCRQIAAHGGLESLSSLIASHFPLFDSPPPSLPKLSLDDDQSTKHLSDQDIDFLVAILGLLVNLVEKDSRNRSQLAATSILVPTSNEMGDKATKDVIPMLCSIFLANQGASEAAAEEQMTLNDEAALIQGEKEAEKMIIEAYSALLLAFLSTDSKTIHDAIAAFLPNHNLASLVPVLEKFVEFHLALDMISPETHTAVSEVIESCRVW
uniref:Wings apart-like protein C-terminal domain-containing protein n=1 Tax=Kalanchoe fedtschenkoi TaxID=63787 RepID=A0A7N0UZH3_KALFE